MQLFIFEGKQIRTIEKDGVILFAGVDVARALMYANPSKAVLDHCKGISKMGMPSDGGVQETNVVTEGDVYRLIVKAADQSKNEDIKLNAERFERLIFDVILPSIRNHGAYMTPQTIEKTLNDPDFIIGLATRLKEETARANEAQRIIDSQKPLVIFAESLQVSSDTLLIGELAKILKQNGINIGGTRLFQKLREDGYLIKSGSQYNLPTQKSMDLGLMEIKVGSRASVTEGSKITKTTKVTGKGQMYFINKYRRVGQEA